MKKHIILVLALVLSSGPLFAQSSHMTDDQVMSFGVKEHERGTANSQIVTKLMHYFEPLLNKEIHSFGMSLLV